jgi:hypothetical protein
MKNKAKTFRIPAVPEFIRRNSVKKGEFEINGVKFKVVKFGENKIQWTYRKNLNS